MNSAHEAQVPCQKVQAFEKREGLTQEKVDKRIFKLILVKEKKLWKVMKNEIKIIFFIFLICLSKI